MNKKQALAMFKAIKVIDFVLLNKLKVLQVPWQSLPFNTLLLNYFVIVGTPLFLVRIC